MKSVKKILILLTVMALCLSVCGGFAGCGKNGGTDPDATAGGGVEHTVTVKTAGGMAMEAVSVAVYADEALSDLKGYGQTDAQGVAKIALPEAASYYIVLSGVPKGYALEAYYTFSGTAANITLTSSLVMDGNLGEVQLKTGDVMYDFTVTTPNGNEIVLSEVLKQKKAVLLNFWYTTCSWCVTEFPYMEKAYEMYKDDVEIIALNPLGESNEAIAAFPASQGLTLSFPMAACPSAWANTFGISGYPTSVIVDRYGVIVLVEEGAIPSLSPFKSLFETVTADDYQQKLYESVSEMVVKPKPNFEMPDSDTVAEILGTTELEISYRAEEGESGEYSWPFIEAEKNGERCLKASNQMVDDSYAILYADVTLKKGQALGFEFLRSTEAIGDFLYVIVDNEDINAISGFNNEEIWETCYSLVADEDGTYEVGFCYLKDEETSVGDDTVYIKNLHIVDESEIDTPTYLPKPVALTEDEFTYTYLECVYNEADGYYHVGSANGPLLLVDLLNATAFDEEDSIWNMAYNGEIQLEGVDYAPELEEYANYALNSNLNGICSVNQELYELLQKVDAAVGFDEADDKEFLKACKYFKAYGTTEQLEDPVKGLAPFSAYTAREGKNISTNVFSYNRVIMPRGLFAEFVPSRSGAYRITSRNDSRDGVDGWIFDENKNCLLNAEDCWERTFNEEGEITMVYYMEAGKPYYINIALKTTNEQIGDVYYDIEYLGSSYRQFVCASPGPFTFMTGETGEEIYYTVAPGIKVVLGEDGYYYHDLGDGQKGSVLYADFTNSTASIQTPIISSGDILGLIDLGGFDFSKTEDDNYILTALKYNDNDQAKTLEYLKTQWGSDYESLYEEYKVDDVFAGKYHGTGEDYTEIMRQYANKIIQSGSELRGCVKVDQQLAEILQLLMDKYTFEGVDTSWRKMCYYYQTIG